MTEIKDLQACERLNVSVISLFYNRKDLSRGFVEYWRREGRFLPGVELLWGDAGSTDGTREMLASCKGFADVEFFEQNLGFSKGNNRLAARARGDVLVFLNNDTLPCDGWLRELVTVFEARPDVGVVGNVQLSVGTRLVDHAGVFFDTEGKPYHFRPPAGSLANLRWMPVPAVTGACLAVRKSLFEKLEGFDPLFVNGYEDTDFCMRARAHTRDILVSTRSHLWHYVASSPGRHAKEDVNEAHFLGRWQPHTRALATWQAPQLRGGLETHCRPLQRFETVQLFYPSPAGFNENDSTRQIVEIGRWSRLEVRLPAASLDSGSVFRLDPGHRPGTYQIAGLSLRDPLDGKLLWQVAGARLQEVLLVAGTVELSEHSKRSFLKSTGHDPQWLLTLPQAVSKTGRPLVLTFWIRVDPSLSTPTPQPPSTRSKTTVAIDLSALQSGGANGGVKVLAWEVVRALEKGHSDVIDLTLLHAPALAPELRAAFPALKQVSAESISAPETLWDTLYAPLGRTRFRPYAKKLVGVVVDLLHRDRPDLLPPEEVLHRETWTVELLAHADAIQVNSAFVRETLCHHYGAGEMRLFLVPNAMQHRLAGKTRGNPHPYFLYPANTWKHKNHERLLQAYATYRNTTSAPWDLVLTGTRTGDNNDGLGAREIDAPGVRWLGFVSEDAYATLLGEAGALIFPSLYEGFGIPVLEALALGVPVGCSRCGSLPEVGRQATHTFDAESAVDIERVLRGLSDGSLGSLPAPHLSDFSWDGAMARLAEALRK